MLCAVQRNWPCDDLIWTYFGSASLAALDKVGEAAFKVQLYQCQMAQALVMTQTHSVMRLKNWAPAFPADGRRTTAAASANTFGIITWMLNEIWPTGGYGSLEYGQAAEGSVVGGRWKPLHYLFRRTLFTDQFAACSVAHGSWTKLLCGVVNDSPWKFTGVFTLTAVDLRSGQSTTLHSESLAMRAGAGVSEWRDLVLEKALQPPCTVLVAAIVNSSGAVVHENLMPLVSPEKMELVAGANVTASVDGMVVTVSADSPAMWVVLTTAAHGRFEDNAFLLIGKRRINFIPFMPGQEDALRRTLRVEHLGGNQISAPQRRPAASV